MSNEKIIKIPDIGGATDVDVIEIMVKEGDEITVDTPLVTLESDKASMEIPSPDAGKIKSLKIKVGDKVSEGNEILVVVVDSVEQEQEQKAEPVKPGNDSSADSNNQSAIARKQPKPPAKKPNAAQSMEVPVPDIGGATDVDVIEILVKEGDKIEKDQSLITLEGDKATMDIPSPFPGKITRISVKVGDKVSQGDLILTMSVEEQYAQEESEGVKETVEKAEQTKTAEVAQKSADNVKPVSQASDWHESSDSVLAGPAVRRLAREFGVQLKNVKGTGRKNRIMKEDVQAYVKARLSGDSGATSGFNLPKAPSIDFSVFGEIETKALNKIKRITGVNVHRSWVTIPHVTQFDEADITQLETFRKDQAEQAKAEGYKLTLLAFVTKVVQKALAKYPQFNASLDAAGENLIYKKYFNVGIAVETPNGLVVPVIKNVDKLEVSEVAKEMARLSTKAREKGLMPAEMSGGCLTISSLGGLGGTAFTPIVNSPEVAILGLSRSAIKPKYENGQWVPRLMLPLSLSYDHRVIDGAEAARFTREIAEMLEDIRRVIL